MRCLRREWSRTRFRTYEFQSPPVRACLSSRWRLPLFVVRSLSTNAPTIASTSLKRLSAMCYVYSKCQSFTAFRPDEAFLWHQNARQSRNRGPGYHAVNLNAAANAAMVTTISTTTEPRAQRRLQRVSPPSPRRHQPTPRRSGD